MFIVFASAVISGVMLSTIGFYISRLGLSTITFCVAHAALAGAAIASLLSLDPYTLSLALSIAVGVALGSSANRMCDKDLNNLSMALFSLFNSLALLSIYFSNTTVLATTRIGGLLWGSLLAVDTKRFIALLTLLTMFTVYQLLFKSQLDTIIFDKRLAEAEGVNTQLHTTLLLILIGVAITASLEIVGGFLVFSAIYIPTAIASSITPKTSKQLVIAAAAGGVAPAIGTAISIAYDTPVGATIALILSTAAFAIAPMRRLVNTVMKM